MVKKSTLISVCFFLSLITLGCAGVDDPKNLVEKDMPSITMMTALEYEAMGGKDFKPERGYLYHLGGMRIMQKIKGGYLIISDIGSNNDPALLYTNREFPQGVMFFSEWAYYVRDVEYTTITGFRKRIYAFKLYDGKFVNQENNNSLTNLGNKQSTVESGAKISRKTEIALIAQRFVKQKLNLPDYSREIIKHTLTYEADESKPIFKFEDIDKKQVVYLGDSRWVVSSYVDYYNSRKYYSVDLIVTPNEEKLNNITFSSK